MMRRYKPEYRPGPNTRVRRKHVRKPPKGTGARLLHCAGLWSHWGQEEIERVRHIIFSSRRSSDYVPDFSRCFAADKEPE